MGHFHQSIDRTLGHASPWPRQFQALLQPLRPGRHDPGVEASAVPGGCPSALGRAAEGDGRAGERRLLGPEGARDKAGKW